MTPDPVHRAEPRTAQLDAAFWYAWARADRQVERLLARARGLRPSYRSASALGPTASGVCDFLSCPVTRAPASASAA